LFTHQKGLGVPNSEEGGTSDERIRKGGEFIGERFPELTIYPKFGEKGKRDTAKMSSRKIFGNIIENGS